MAEGGLLGQLHVCPVGPLPVSVGQRDVDNTARRPEPGYQLHRGPAAGYMLKPLHRCIVHHQEEESDPRRAEG